ncbi:hypothetical protein BO94DRAFT_180611 [Aspergillus sclerotioniger CBS 115572]|uniref:DUF7587 domain-containing protein n=1 Tax=Aspergillus sclerotioniger CBS 115572 TaxID=1450535 RepID=A0A317VW45_9EURO|nr:hypothetical protein BO94DRAFT_180611 [Aspergillus sclerotioniger CBS 115572]PWY78533.1 hypothetical protein BO94DRAFT_180611 [Aspergillus sclerotioniger CBS 115572]
MGSPIGLSYKIPVPKNRWSWEQRTFLCCLHEYFRRDRKVFKDIFNHVFESQVKECGLVDGISWRALDSQWRELERFSYPEWREVHQASLSGNRRWRPILAQIKRAARDLGLHVVQKYIDENYTPSFRPTPTPPANVRDAQSPSNSVIQSLEGMVARGEQEQPESELIGPTQNNASLCNGGGKVCLWCAQEQATNEEISEQTSSSRTKSSNSVPPLLYRWSNIDSQGVNSKKLFLAGLFADGREYFSPEDISSEEFSQYFLIHAYIEEKPTPFISTFTSMLSPVHRALRGKEGAIISIIDTKKLDTALFSAHDNYRTRNLRIRGYNGGGEWLVWGRIPSAAIICAVKISTIQQLAAQHFEIGKLLQLAKIASHKFNRKKLHEDLARGAGNLDRASGFAIGKFLVSIGLPLKFRKDVSEGLVRSWRVKRTGSWDTFYEGLDAGYGLNSRPFSARSNEAGSPEPVSYESSDEDSVTECGDASDGELEALAASSPCPRGRGQTEDHIYNQTLENTPEQNSHSNPHWSPRKSTGPDSELAFNGIAEPGNDDLFVQPGFDQSAEQMSDWPDEDEAQELLSLTTPSFRPLIELFNPDTGGWVQEQAELRRNLDGQPSSMQSVSFHDMLGIRGMSDIESDILFDIERCSTTSMSRESSEDIIPQHRFAEDRERRRLWLQK